MWMFLLNAFNCVCVLCSVVALCISKWIKYDNCIKNYEICAISLFLIKSFVFMSCCPFSSLNRHLFIRVESKSSRVRHWTLDSISSPFARVSRSGELDACTRPCYRWSTLWDCSRFACLIEPDHWRARWLGGRWSRRKCVRCLARIALVAVRFHVVFSS